jgi:hypothetical protein
MRVILMGFLLLKTGVDHTGHWQSSQGGEEHRMGWEEKKTGSQAGRIYRMVRI